MSGQYGWLHCRCLGSTQHLKDKYGSGYVLEVKLTPEPTVAATDHKMAALHTFVKGHFLNVDISECFGDRVTYSIPQESVGSLANSFKILEEGWFLINPVNGKEIGVVANGL